MKPFSIAMILIASVLGGCATSTPDVQNLSDEAYQYPLTEQKHADFDSVMIKTSLPRFAAKSIFFADLGLDNTVIIQPSQIASGIRTDFSLNEKEKSGMVALFDSAITRYFSEENGFSTVDDPDDADIIIIADILTLQPSAPKDDMNSRRISTRYFTEGSGNMTVEFNVYQNEQKVMKIEDSRDAGRFWEQNMRLSNKQNVKMLFNSWAKDLAEILS